jgi:erythromycin esterase-like protein
MKTATISSTADIVSDSARVLSGGSADFDPIVNAAARANFVLIGEASHGTHEFYRTRAELTKRLVQELAFNAVAIEGDWPDAYRVNRFVRGRGEDSTATAALGGFMRFPQWMWRNAEVVEFVKWLRAHNDSAKDEARKTGFYGLDLYSLDTSRHSVLEYLRAVDPAAARRAAERYSCFDHFEDDPQGYGHAAALGITQSCEDDAVTQLVEMRRAAAHRPHDSDPDTVFAAEQNARLVVDAERYYREMFRGRVSSWNLRDSHMAETLEELSAHIARRSGRAKIVVWAHNSHLGSARATEMRLRGEYNLGQLVRDKHGRKGLLVGFSTYDGTVTAASNWDEPAQRKQVRPALSDSYEALFHQAHAGDFLVDLTREADVVTALRPARLQRAIGVIYRPETERVSHYYQAMLPEQFDFMIHHDRTRAVEPLEKDVPWTHGEDAPETYPTAL